MLVFLLKILTTIPTAASSPRTGPQLRDVPRGSGQSRADVRRRPTWCEDAAAARRDAVADMRRTITAAPKPDAEVKAKRRADQERERDTDRKRTRAATARAAEE